MARINFKEFEMPTDITRKQTVKGDARESFANLLYTRATGIRMHALAMKIYESTGAEDYSAEEVRTMRQAAEQWCVPAFIDGLDMQINDNEEVEPK